MPQQLSSLLRTKLFIVRPRDERVERRALTQKLDLIPRRKLTLVSAPAGFGKTTAVGAWLERNDHPVAWISLDAADSSLPRFLAYLVAALQTIDPALGEGVAAALDTAPMPPAEMLMGSLVNDLAQLDRDIVLVLDDYNSIEGQGVHDALLFLLEHAPPMLHVVVMTRVDPPIPLARFRVRGDMVEIRAADLRFSPEETEALFNQVMALDLPEHHLAALLEKTEGWIAGLHMAAISLQGRNDVDAFIRAFTGADRYVLDYLLEEALSQLPEDLQHIVLRLSILSRFNGDLCEAVAGCDDGVAILHELERRNLFLISLDNRREWYRYHHLFAELLRHRLSQKFGEEVPALHRRAAEWHSERRNAGEALHHAQLSGDPVLLARMVDAHWRELLRGNDSRYIWSLVSELPDDIALASPGAALQKGWLLTLYNRFDEAELMLRKLADLLGDPGDNLERRQLLGIVWLIRATIMRDRGNASEAMRLAGRALELLPDVPMTSPLFSWHASTGIALSVMAAAQGLAGDHRAAESTYRESVAYGRRSGNSYGLMTALMNLGRYQVQIGRLADASATVGELRLLIDTLEFATPLARFTRYLMEAHILCEHNELDAAVEAVEAGLRLAVPLRATILLQMLQIAFRVDDARGDMEGAMRRIEAIEKARIYPHEEYLQEIAPMLRAQLALRAGDITAASQWMNRLQEERGEREDDRPGVATHLHLFFLDEILSARILAAEGEIERGEEKLAGLQQRLDDSGERALLLEAMTLRALLLYRLERQDAALELLAQALSIGAPDGYVRPFAYEGEEIGRMILQLRGAHSQEVPGEYMKQIMAACMQETPVDMLPPQPSERLSTGELQLTVRELEILRLIALGYSNQKIADKLYVSINTIKTHASNLFDKLGASNRVDALMKAREGGIL